MRRSASSRSGSSWWKTRQVRCLLIQSGLPDLFWAEATVTVAYLINRSPSTALEKNTPMGKLKPKAIKCIFLGYPEGILGKEVEFEVEHQGSRVEPTMNPHTGENPGNEDEEQDEEPQ
ncbi:hypothetical protein Tco_0051664 [Tanacetum coccineum]